ncbi:MAG: hypothetical protein EXR95_03900 [Gemmatimonadetes bacterium]|nr:hypothetical protein [Gemmatimonadota bacterium]
MGFLAPWILLAAATVAVPAFLHLFHRSDSRRLSFPALRYLLRTEREHARRIRFRQLLLLLLRAAVIVLLALAGARPFFRGVGGAHPPTALAIVLDNSLSSGRVVGAERVLDGLKRRALAAIAGADAEDRIWVVRAGEPWDVATPGDGAAASERVLATEVSAAAADLTDPVRRAAGLVRQAGLPAAEVHVLSDLQATALGGGAPGAGEAVSDVPILVLRPAADAPANHYLGSVLVGGGLPPLAGRRSELVVGVGGDTTELPLRLVVGDRIRGAARAPAGASAILPFGPFAAGWVDGFVETDPDELGGDDRRWFALPVLPPPAVSVRGNAPFFVQQALAVLEEGGRLTRAAERADVIVAIAGEGADQARSGRAIVVLPPADADLLPGLNRRLVEAGIPWRYVALAATGETRLGEHRLPLPLEQVRVARAYGLESTEAGAGAEVLARLEDGTPWVVRGHVGASEYRLVGSAFEPDATNVPVSAAMVPLFEWLISTSARGSAARALDAGASIPLPAAATAVRSPDGAVHPVDPAQDFRITRDPGIYLVLAGDSVLDEVAVNPPLRESLLAPADVEAVARALGGSARLIDADSGAWAATAFTTRQGSEIWRPLVAAALLLLVAETGIAARGARPELARSPTP